MTPRTIEVIEDTFKLPPFKCEMLQVSVLKEDGTPSSTSSSTLDLTGEVPVGEFGTLIRFVGGNGLDVVEPIKVMPRETKSDIELDEVVGDEIAKTECSKDGCDKSPEDCDKGQCGSEVEETVEETVEFGDDDSEDEVSDED